MDVENIIPVEATLVRAQSGPLHFRFSILARCGFLGSHFAIRPFASGRALKPLLKTWE
jgi:hypothetical protein